MKYNGFLLKNVLGGKKTIGHSFYTLGYRFCFLLLISGGSNVLGEGKVV